MTDSLEREKVITSVTIYRDDLEWIKRTDYSVSAFVREAVSEKILRETGAIFEIERLRARLREIEQEREMIQKKLEELESVRTKVEKEKELRKINSLIERAILRIPYEDWEDAAKDLEESRGRLSIEEWRSLVKRKWDELRGEENDD